jgi:sugar lactone lactonase YvrE
LRFERFNIWRLLHDLKNKSPNSLYMKILYSRNTYLSLLLLLFVLLNDGCKKSSTSTTSSDTAPSVSTTDVILNVTSTSAQSGGVITSLGNEALTANGVCYSSTATTPTTNDEKTSDAIATNQYSYPPFTSQLTNLTPNTTYYVRAYATNSKGTGYGKVIKFTTSASLTAITTTVTTLAGSATSGYLDGSGTGAQFNNPQGVTVDSQGNLVVSDSYNSVIRGVTSSGVVNTLAGLPGIGYVDGPAATAQFYAPRGSAFDANGNLYVADFGNNVIRKITPAGVVSTYAGSGTPGYRNGAATSANLTSSSDSLAMFNNPQAVAVDAAGNVYVADRGNNVIRKILPTGRTVTLAGNKKSGYLDATAAAAYFNAPSGVAVDANGNVYVADQGNSAIRKVTSAQVVTTIAGGPTQSALFNLPAGLAMDKKGNLFIADEGGRIFEYTSANVLYQLAGSLNVSGFVDGPGTSALFNNPQGIAIDANGAIYVADQYNNCIRKIVVTITD